MKKVLIVTYYWPPSGGSGVQRWMYFSKYLSEFGYEPIILTVSEKSASYKNEDLSFLDFVKDIQVHKTKSFEPLKLYSKLTTGDSKKGIPMGNVESSKKGLIYKLSLYVRGNFFIPDARVGWNRYAIKRAKSLIKEQEIKLVITTGPPNSSHLIGLELQKELRIKWIADFRDPWTDIYYNRIFNRSKRAQDKDEKLEKLVLSSADRVVTVGKMLRALLIEKVPELSPKFHYLYNGYDAFAMDRLIKKKHDDFEFTLIGLLTYNQPYVSFKNALKILKSNYPEFKATFSLAGNIDHSIIEELKVELPFIEFELKGYINHKSALELMKQADLLVNFLPEMEHSEILISGKQMEYIATGNPILCIGNTKGECAMLLENVDNAEIFEKQQEREISNFIGHIYQKWINGEEITVPSNSENIRTKSRFEVTRKLAQLLDELI